ncbi:hypothetical protein FSP39_016007 [Pinctada imbricata]|uniref:DZIP3-like HEPN domain-containing protein n=1 Tax=Pinctada imbricata TaxID=66713 RepID=A0AA88YMZ1_PINIB|nr:hypothetical protein FSP39_016007 [Pinctada imbricata]
MSVDDEIRYGRTCSLVLNKSVTVLRRVVKHSYTTQGARSFEVYLNNNKHTLFHLLFKQCCCGNNCTVTPLSKYQWQLLYVRTSTRNPHGRRGECPCQYTAISGVTLDVMDVSLCCLVLRNICSGVSMPDIDTIRDVRNQLIHTSNASLDATLYSDTWNKVEAAMLNLAQGVSSSFKSNTLNAAQALKKRLMDSSELSEMKALVMDEKRISEIERVCACSSPLNYKLFKSVQQISVVCKMLFSLKEFVL